MGNHDREEQGEHLQISNTLDNHRRNDRELLNDPQKEEQFEQHEQNDENHHDLTDDMSGFIDQLEEDVCVAKDDMQHIDVVPKA